MLEETAKQKDQSIIWDYFQNEGIEAFSQSLPRLRFLVARVKAEAMLLNIGVGDAILERLAIEKGIDIHSLDPNNRAVEKLRAQFMLGEKAKKGTSQNIPFAAGTFDAVVMSEVLEHLTENEFDATLSEVDRVLKLGGSFIVTVPFNEDLKSSTAICPHCAEQFHRWGHLQTFDVSKLRRLFQEKGFEIRKVETRCFPDWSRPGIKNWLKSASRYILGRFGAGIAKPNIFLEATKN